MMRALSALVGTRILQVGQGEMSDIQIAFDDGGTLVGFPVSRWPFMIGVAATGEFLSPFEEVSPYEDSRLLERLKGRLAEWLWLDKAYEQARVGPRDDAD